MKRSEIDLTKKLRNLVKVGVQNLWGCLKDGVLRTCDKVGRKKRIEEAKEIHGGEITR